MLNGTGAVPGGEVRLDASGSSQFVSALLLSGAAYDKGVVIRHSGPPVPSMPHIDMTVSMLAQAGVSVEVTDRDRPLLDAIGEGLLSTGWTGTPEHVAAQADAAAEAGVTELAYVPAGPDIARELRAFAEAVRRS